MAKEEKKEKLVIPEIKLSYTKGESVLNVEKINQPSDAEKILRQIFDPGEIELREQVIVLYLNKASKVIGYYKHSTGGIDSSIIDVRLILAAALKSLSTGIILCHNHPTGQLKPSSSDQAITRKIKNASTNMDIQLLDHIIITKDGFYSFSDEGLNGIKTAYGSIENTPTIVEEKSKGIIYLDLFSGTGGFAKGLLEAGFTFKKHYYSEIDKFSIANFQYNFKHAHNLGDIKKIKAKQIERPDLITFGSPCQDISLAGERNGLKGQRSRLFFEAIRLIKEYKPRVFIFENVKGIFSSNEGKDFEKVLRTFAELGLYDCQWQLLNTSWFLPQNRERLYLVGTLRKESATEIFPIGKHTYIPAEFAKKRKKSEIVSTITTTASSPSFHCPFLIYPGNSVSKYKGLIRKFTPLEFERLQGFPDNWTANGIMNGEVVAMSDSQRYKMLGNAVSVPVVKAIAKKLLNKKGNDQLGDLEERLCQFNNAA